MVNETDIINLKLRVRELEERLKYLYTHLNITYVESVEPAIPKSSRCLKRATKSKP